MPFCTAEGEDTKQTSADMDNLIILFVKFAPDRNLLASHC